MSQRDREGRLAFINRLPHNQRTYPSDCEAEARKSRPLWGKVAPTGDGRGELAFKSRLLHNLATHPSDCKAGARNEPSPLGEGGRREPDGRGELALNLRLPHNQRTYPSDCKAGARKKPSPLGKVAPTGDGRGELTLKPRLPPNKDTEPSLPSMELRGGGPVRARRGVTPSHNHHSLST